MYFKVTYDEVTKHELDSQYHDTLVRNRRLNVM